MYFTEISGTQSIFISSTRGLNHISLPSSSFLNSLEPAVLHSTVPPSRSLRSFALFFFFFSSTRPGVTHFTRPGYTALFYSSNVNGGLFNSIAISIPSKVPHIFPWNPRCVVLSICPPRHTSTVYCSGPAPFTSAPVTSSLSSHLPETGKL